MPRRTALTAIAGDYRVTLSPRRSQWGDYCVAVYPAAGGAKLDGPSSYDSDWHDAVASYHATVQHYQNLAVS